MIKSILLNILLLEYFTYLYFTYLSVEYNIIADGIAITVNLAVLYYAPQYYDITALTQVFYAILTTPISYWSIIVLSAIGSFSTITAISRHCW